MPLLPIDEIIDILAEETAKLSSLSDDPFSAAPCVTLITTALSHVGSEHSVETINAIFSILVHWREKTDNIFFFAS